MTEPSSNSGDAVERFRAAARRKVRQLLGPQWGERVHVFVQFWEIVVTGFVNNRCPVRATALAYTTLLALIPMLAVAASISTGILKSQGEAPIEWAIDALVRQVAPEVDDDSLQAANGMRPLDTTAAEPGGSSTNVVNLTEEQRQKLKELAETVDRDKIAHYIKDSLNNIESGSLGVSGMFGLIVVAIMLFSTIEATFNDIWGVSRGRSWVARVVQYWATVTLGPLIPIVVFSFNVGSSLDSVQGWMDRNHLGFISQFAIERLAPLAVLSFGFAFFYQLMPNTKVRWTAALVGGVTGGLLWNLNSLLSVLFVSKVVTQAKIYGSLAMIPVFLFGLYLSWLILLFGAQVAYAFQNRVAYLQEKEAQRINFLGREYLALRIMTLIAQRFDDFKGGAPSVIDIAHALRVSTRLVDDILKSMAAAGLVMETVGRETGYTLTRPLEKVSCHDILMALRTARGDITDTAEDTAKHAVDVVFEQVLSAEKAVSARTTLRQLVDEAGASTAPDPGAVGRLSKPAWSP
jgi:membrane protein